MSGFENGDHRAIRWEKRRLRSGEPNPECSVCGFADLRALCCVRGRTSQTIRTICTNDRLKEQALSDSARTRKLLRLATAGYHDPSCLFCSEADLRTLQLHHVSGEANSILGVPLCGNCHAIVSDQQEDLPLDLRLRDPDRRPLLLQAAFNFGLAIITGMIGLGSKDGTETAFWAIITVGLIAWAVWDIAADGHFAARFGADYSDAVPAPVPR